MSNHDAYVKKIKAKLDEWSADISKLEAKADGAQADLEIDYKDKISKIKQQRKDVLAKLNELQSASGNAWEDTKTGIENSYKSLDKALSSALSRFQ